MNNETNNETNSEGLFSYGQSSGHREDAAFAECVPEVGEDVATTRDELIEVVTKVRNYLSWIQDTTELSQVVDTFQTAASCMREARKLLDAEMTEHIAEHGELKVGETTWILAKKKTTKCTNVLDTAQALLEATGGDFEAFANVMTTQPYKAASVKTVIGDERWAKLFSVTFSSSVQLQQRRPQ